MLNVYKSERKRASARYLISDTFTRTVNRLAQRGLIMGRTLCGSSMARAIILSVGVGLISCYGKYCSRQSMVRRVFDNLQTREYCVTRDDEGRNNAVNFSKGIRVYRLYSLFAGATNPSRIRNCVYFHISYPPLLSLS